MAESASDQFRAQWAQPSDVFSVLLIVGGDIVQLAVAALAGRSLTPVAFSFGWVAYAISAVVSAVGENRLVRCPPEIPCKVFNLRSGYERANNSWLLARLVKTYESWMPAETRAAKSSLWLPPPLNPENPRLQGDEPSLVALCITVFQWEDQAKNRPVPGYPAPDWLWWSGFFVSAIQIAISAIPWAQRGNWAIFLVTTCGTVLSYTSASLPQWRLEKWHTRRTSEDVALTPGNGFKHVIIVLGVDHGLSLEALAGGRAPNLLSTRVFTTVMAALWLAFLIACTGLTSDSWFLLAVGGLGMVQNLVVAGMARSPAALGLPIKPAVMADGRPEIFAERKVMWALMALEEQRKGWGAVLLREYFPRALRDWEKTWWESEDPEERRRLLTEAQEKEADRILKRNARLQGQPGTGSF